MRINHMALSRFEEFFLTPVGIGVCIVLFLALVIGVIVLIRVKTKKSRAMKQIYNEEQHFVNIQTLPISAKLVKIQQIGNRNVVFARIYEEYKTLYEETAENCEDDIKSEFRVAKEQVQAGEYKNLQETIKGLKIKLAAYETKMQEIDELVSNVTKDEDIAKSKEEVLRNTYSKCKEIFRQNEIELFIFNEEYQERFRIIDEQLEIYTVHLNRGSYEDAKECLVMIERLINNLYANLQVAPKFTNVATKIIPEKINQIIDEYLEMQNAGYPLYHTLANSRINAMKDSLGQIIYAIRNFSFDGLDEKLSGILDRVNELRDELTKEKEARLYFEKDSKIIYNKAEDLERLYIKYMKDANVLSRVYELSESTKVLSETTKIEVNKLSVIRRTLDSITYGKQPYSKRIDKLNELKAQVEVVENAINSYRSNFEDMRDDSNLAYDLVTEATSKLKKLQLQIRNTKIEKLRSNFIESFNHGYNLIDRLGVLISSQPIDIAKVNKYNKELKNLVEKVEKEATIAVAKAEFAEKVIMFANTYRSQFADVARSAAKAELYFYDAKFDDAIELIKDSLKRFVDISYLEEAETKLREVEAQYV